MAQINVTCNKIIPVLRFCTLTLIYFLGLPGAIQADSAVGRWQLSAPSIDITSWPELQSRKCTDDAARPSGNGITHPYKAHICIAEFRTSEDWHVQPNRKLNGIKLTVGKDPERKSDVLVLHSDIESHKHTPGIFKLTSPMLGEQSFSYIDSIRVWVKGNRTNDRITVLVQDSKGKLFVGTRRVRLTSDHWIAADIPFFPNGFTHYKDVRESTPTPPYQISGILYIQSPEYGRNDVRLDGISVFGTPFNGKTLPLLSSHSEDNKLELTLSKPYGYGLFLPANQYKPTGTLLSRYDSDISVEVVFQVSRLYGPTQTAKTILTIPSGKKIGLSPPIILIQPGAYIVDASVRATGIRESLREHTEYYVWEPIGNSYTDPSSETFFGAMLPLDAFNDTMVSDLQLLAQAGVRIVRIPFRWNRVETKPGKFQWQLYDRIMAACRQYRITPYLMAIGTPEWATDPDKRKDSGRKTRYDFIPPKDLEEFSNFLGRAAARYAEFNPYWEIWNEPYAAHYWVNSTPLEYVNLLKNAYRAIKKEQPGAVVMNGGLGNTGEYQRHFTEYLLANGAEFMDAYAIHSHGRSERLRTTIEYALEAMNQAHITRPIWLNETGIWVDPRSPDGELTRAAETVKKIVMARESGLANYGWFIFRNYPRATMKATTNFAALDKDSHARPVVLAYNNAARHLHETMPLGQLNINGRITVYQFTSNNGRYITILWATDPEDYYPLPFQPDTITGTFYVYDMLGGQIPAAEAGHIPVGAYPVFIIGDKSTKPYVPRL